MTVEPTILIIGLIALIGDMSGVESVMNELCPTALFIFLVPPI
jgi:hypothetical protein